MKKVSLLVMLSFLLVLVACASPSSPTPERPPSVPVLEEEEASNDIEPSLEEQDQSDSEDTLPHDTQDDAVLDQDTTIDDEEVFEPEVLRLTLSERAQFDGREGRRGIIAVSGILYEVTNSRRWRNGNHNGYQAGQDLTDAILGVSPHGVRVLDNPPQVGFLID